MAAIPDSDTTYAGAHAPITFTIAQKPVNVTLGSGSVTKVYDSTTIAGAGTINLTTGDILSGDSGVTVTTGTIPAYSASAVGASYSLAVPVALNGDSNSNYTLSNSTVAVTGEITAKPVTLMDGTLAITKEYDGTNSAGTATGVLSTTDFVAADSGNISVSVTSVGTYADASVAANKTISLNVGLTGSAAGNYSLTNNTYSFTKATITKATPTVNVTVVKKATRSFFALSIGSKEDTFIITATVTGVNGEKPTGTVNFKNGTTAITSNVNVTNGTATYEWEKPSASTYTITAEFTPTSGNSKNATGTIKGIGTVTITITATKADDNDYNATTATTIITVNAAAPTLAWDTTTQSATYTGNVATITAPKVTLKGSDTNTATIQYAYKSTSLFSLFAGYTDGLPTDAGEYKIKAHY